MQWDFESKYFELDNLWLQISMGDLTIDDIKNIYQKIRDRYFTKSEKYQDIRLESTRVEKKSKIEWAKFLNSKYKLELE